MSLDQKRSPTPTDPFELAVAHTFGEEGGYVDDPDDSGGPTNMGVTLATMAEALGKDVDRDGFLDGDLDRDGDIDAEDVKRLSRAQAKEIYRERYWTRPGFHLIRDPRVAAKVFDIGVNAHPRVATVLLQRAICHAAPPGVAHPRDDGVLGPKTLAALAGCDPEVLLGALRSEQKSFYLRLIEKDPRKAKWKRGWLARAERLPREEGVA